MEKLIIKKLEGEIDQLKKMVTVLSHRILKLEAQNSYIKNDVHQQKININSLSQKLQKS
jgi:hypothetical protein